MARCSGITRGGAACRGIPIGGSGYCHAHHPDRAEERRRHGRRGGKLGGRGRPQAELHAVKGRLSEMADAVLAGTLDRADASVVGQLLNTYIRALGVELRVREQLEVLERMEALEEAIEQQKRERGRYGA